MYSSSFDLYGSNNSNSRYETLFDRKPSYLSSYSSDYSSSNGRTESAYDRYTTSYINDLTGFRTGAYTTSNSNYGSYSGSSADDYLTPSYRSGGNGYSGRRKYVFEPEVETTKFEPLSSKYSSYGGSSSSGYSSNSSYSSYLNSESSYTPSFRSSRFGAIASAPAYDKFGKELSNYERWKLSQGGFEDSFNNNSSSSSSTNSNDYSSRTSGTSSNNEAQALRRKRFSRADDSVKPSSALTFKDREFSVIPQSNSSFLDDDTSPPPAITGSRFSGKAVVPRTRASIEPGFLPSISGNSGSSYNSRTVTSFPADVRSKVSWVAERNIIITKQINLELRFLQKSFESVPLESN